MRARRRNSFEMKVKNVELGGKIKQKQKTMKWLITIFQNKKQNKKRRRMGERVSERIE